MSYKKVDLPKQYLLVKLSTFPSVENKYDTDGKLLNLEQKENLTENQCRKNIAIHRIAIFSF